MTYLQCLSDIRQLELIFAANLVATVEVFGPKDKESFFVL